MVKLTIDGQKVEVEKGTTVLESAQKLGIKIPTLCYHKALTPYGACRLCIVEIEQNGVTQIHASCLYKVQEGLVVRTNTERVKKDRKIMIELLLARCPDSKEIQELAEQLGVKETRIKKKYKDCSLCGLCVRMCEERMGKAAVSFINRGSRREVKPPFDMKSDICQTCGACVFICPNNIVKLEEITENEPIPIPSEFDMGLISRPAIHIPFPQALPSWATIDKDNCAHFLTEKCEVCKEFCEADAIDFEQKEKRLKIKAGAIILTPGYGHFDAKLKGEYGYGWFKNVVTSMEFERMLSASGPYEGHVVRLSDEKEPKKIAWIQCVGSRDTSVGKGYCSSVCCTYAIKEAVIAKEHIGKSLKPTIFYMDMRTYGKDFDKYQKRAEVEYGVRFIRSKVPAIEEAPKTKNLIVTYETEDGKIEHEEFDLVVLSTGFNPPEGAKELAAKLGIELNNYGFCKTDRLTPLQTTRKGIFVSGAFSGPKDIPETVMQASGAAANAEALISEARNTLVKPKEYPPEIDVSGQEPRIGAFICHCGINIGGFVDVPSVVEYVKTLPNVVYAEDNLFTCSEDTQRKIKETIKEHNLNRVIVASCTPRTHETLFQETIREAGLNKHLFEMANIRDQCSWIHMKEPEEATIKAKDLVRMAVAKARLIEPLPSLPLDVTQKGLVIGGGLAGMVTARGIANQGYEVYLIEKEKELGGNLRNIYYTLEGNDIQEYLKSLIEEVEKNPLIHVYKDTKIEKIEGFVGNYKTEIRGHQTENRKKKSETKTLEHGIIIVAIGAKEYQPTEYLYGKHDRVITQLELEKRLAEDRGLKPDVRKQKSENIKQKKDKQPSDICNMSSVVMIQCVGSRDEKRQYCSRVCCPQAIKNALKIKEVNPDSNIYILYRDVRTYGFREDYFRKARETGITFIRYDEYNKPEVITQRETLKVSLKEPLLNYQLILDADLLVLSVAMVPQSDNLELAQMLKVPLNEDNFFLEAHVKLRPVDFATEGIFLAGLSHSPKLIDETIAQANAAVSRACTIISKDKYFAEPTIAVVNEDLCSGCGTCESICSYEAVEVVEELVGWVKKRKAHVKEALCKGCGTCAATCPSGAIEQKGFKSEQLLEMIDVALEP